MRNPPVRALWWFAGSGVTAKIHLRQSAGKEESTDRILSVLNELIQRCRGPEGSWMAQDLRRAVELIGGLDEEVARRILDQEGL